jgi:hypothetical protein
MRPTKAIPWGKLSNSGKPRTTVEDCVAVSEGENDVKSRYVGLR